MLYMAPSPRSRCGLAKAIGQACSGVLASVKGECKIGAKVVDLCCAGDELIETYAFLLIVVQSCMRWLTLAYFSGHVAKFSKASL